MTTKSGFIIVSKHHCGDQYFAESVNNDVSFEDEIRLAWIFDKFDDARKKILWLDDDRLKIYEIEFVFGVTFTECLPEQEESRFNRGTN